MVGWKLNQLELINLTNILVDMCLTNILVKYIGYLLTNVIGCKLNPTQIGYFNQQFG